MYKTTEKCQRAVICNDSKNKKHTGVSFDSEANASKKVRSDSNIPEEVLVEEWRLTGVNGTY